jgi:hypothetical protein
VIAATEQAGLDGTGCTIDQTEVAYLEWDATALGDDFGEYQIERGESSGFFALFPGFANGDVVGQAAQTGQVSRSNHIPSGVTPDGQSADITGGFLVGATAGGWYTWWDTGIGPVRFGGGFIFDAGSTFAAAAGFIVSDVYDETDPYDIVLNSVHISVLTIGYAVAFYDGAQEPARLTHFFDTPLADDGATVHAFSVSIDGNTLTIVDPEGHTETVTDARAGRLWGDTVLLENFQPTATFATDALPEFAAAAAYDPDDDVYYPIYTGDTEAAEQVTDWEAGFGQTWTYRIRVVRAGDWVPSAWSDDAFVAIAAQDAETCFGSNWLQTAAAVNREPDYEWPQPNNDQVLQLAGRDYQVVFQEVEDRGDGGDSGFTFEVVGYVGGGNAPNLPTPAGRAMWDPLRDYLRQFAPHIAIKDWTGDVWFGRATLDPAGVGYGDDGSAVALGEVTVIETQALPTPAPIPAPGS